ncbi:alpha/beta hydrolase [Pseudomonas sp. LRF_L74]|uniref:alpha/beta hydrolase n=1 Tax=Pseudomonas sp. LRF_L74 TaxID=3369422 RepID=UPI003F5F311B
MSELKLAVIDVKPGTALESQSGLQMLRPRIYGAFMEPAGKKKVAAIVMHPTSNFMGHYLIDKLAAQGICCMGLNSRYMGNDTLLLMERVIQDLGAGVKYLRERGYEKVVLIGNSGGAALAAFYQAQAEQLTAHHFIDGDPTHLHPRDLPPVDGIALAAAHLGRSRLLADWIDPAVTDELDPLSLDPDLDMYDVRHQGRYSPAFIAAFRSAQRQRIKRIEQWAIERLRLLRRTEGAPRDQVFVVHRTHADPRCVDLSLDCNDRLPGSVWGDARAVNYSANAMGRVTSLTAFLSQWSSLSQADGPTNLARTTVPKLLLTYTADQSTFPSTRDAWLKAGGSTIHNKNIVGGNHYLAGQPERVLEAAALIADWAHSL